MRKRFFVDRRTTAQKRGWIDGYSHIHNQSFYIVNIMWAKKQTDPGDYDQGPDRIVSTTRAVTWRVNEAVRLRMDESRVMSSQPVSVITAFKKVAKEHPDNIALVDMYEEEEESYTYRKYYKTVVHVSRVFIKLGLNSHRGVGIIGHNSPQCFISHLSSIHAGGVSAAIPPSCSDDTICHLAEKAECEIIVVEDERHLKRVLKLTGRLTFLKAVVLCRGSPLTSAANVYSWQEVLEMCVDECKEEQELRLKHVAPNKCCALVAKSGAEGHPKWVMLSHDNILWAVKSFQAYINDGQAKCPITVLSYRSLSKLSALYVDVYWTMMSDGGTAYIAHPAAMQDGTLLKAVKRVRPTVLYAPPPVWEDIMDSALHHEESSNYIKKQFIVWARSVGYAKYLSDATGDNDPPMFSVAKHVALENLSREIGLDRCRLAISGPARKGVTKFFLSLDITVLEVYGISECGPISANRKSNFKVGAAGRTLPGVQVKLRRILEDAEEEILCRGRNVFMGYLKDEDATRDAFSRDLWLHTKDIGRVDKDGFLYVSGSLSEVIILSNGINVIPSPIENKVLKKLPCLSHCFLVGEGKQYLSALLVFKTKGNLTNGEPSNILHPRALEWCRSVGSSAQKLSHVVNSNEVALVRAVQKAIDAVNSERPSEKEWIRKWTILPRAFSASRGQCLKLKRSAVSSSYQKEIESLYE